MLNQKVYIGSTANRKNRWRGHRRLLKNGTHHSKHLQRAWGKHGEKAFVFSVIEEVFDPLNLVPREQWHIDRTQCYKAENGYNGSPTAGSCLGVKHSDETKKKWSESRQGRKLSPEHVEKMRVACPNYGRPVLPETREKIAAANLGRKQSAETIKKRADKLRGRTRTDETRARMSAAQKGLKKSPLSMEHKAKLSAATKGRKQSREAIEKRVAPLRGRKLSPGHIAKISEANRGKKLSDETRAKLSASHMGHPVSAATRAKISESRKARNQAHLQAETVGVESNIMDPDIQQGELQCRCSQLLLPF